MQLKKFLPNDELITGMQAKFYDLRLSCPICKKTFSNIDNILCALQPNEDDNSNRLFYVIYINENDVCNCLFDYFERIKENTNRLPIISLSFGGNSLN